MATKYSVADNVRLGELLCKAAGIEMRLVRSITCRVAINEAVSFTIEKIGDGEDIQAALSTYQPKDDVSLDVAMLKSIVAKYTSEPLE